MGYAEGKIDRNQVSLIPISFDELIGDDNPVGVIDAFVEMLNPKELGFRYSEPSATGRPPYNPKDMLKLYLYGYFNVKKAGKSPRPSTRTIMTGRMRSLRKTPRCTNKDR